MAEPANLFPAAGTPSERIAAIKSRVAALKRAQAVRSNCSNMTAVNPPPSLSLLCAARQRHRSLFPRSIP